MSALPDLEALVAQLRGGFFARLMRKAQKAALLEWRDRREPPGLAARFTFAGEKFYGFGDRWGQYWMKKGGLPDYVKTGRTRDLNLKRQPKSSNTSGSDVVTRLVYGGGNLFNLTTVGGLVSFTRVSERVPVVRAAYSYNHYKTGSLVSVAPTPTTRKRIRLVIERGSRSMADEFGDFVHDRGWIANRVGELFRDLFRSLALTKGGQLKAKAIRGEGDA